MKAEEWGAWYRDNLVAFGQGGVLVYPGETSWYLGWTPKQLADFDGEVVLVCLGKKSDVKIFGLWHKKIISIIPLEDKESN